MTGLIADLLRRRASTHGGEPLLTYYDLDAGERTELSAVTFANWVDKTANLIIDEIGADPGEVISLPLAAEAPGHWITFVWELACWQTGLVADLTDPEGEVAVVTGRDWEPYAWREVYACALHPLGFGFSEPLAVGVHDYAVEVRSQPDAYAGPTPEADAPAWHDAERTRSQADLLADAAGPTPGRRLVRPADPWSATRAGLLVPLLTGGSSVVVLGGDENAVDRVAVTERAAAD